MKRWSKTSKLWRDKDDSFSILAKVCYTCERFPVICKGAWTPVYSLKGASINDEISFRFTTFSQLEEWTINILETLPLCSVQFGEYEILDNKVTQMLLLNGYGCVLCLGRIEVIELTERWKDAEV